MKACACGQVTGWIPVFTSKGFLPSLLGAGERYFLVPMHQGEHGRVMSSPSEPLRGKNRHEKLREL